jgi:hypothetical protein
VSAAFTPGPWTAEPMVPLADNAFYITASPDGNNSTKDVATVGPCLAKTTAANARLIAAAPELLAVIGDPEGLHDPLGFVSALIIDLKDRLEGSKVFRTEWEGDDPASAWECLSEVEALIERARAALAKARGES